jgi:hypothetical protein
MAYQRQTKSDNRRIWKKVFIDPSDNEGVYEAVSFKIKDKNFSRPIILNYNLASDYANKLFN